MAQTQAVTAEGIGELVKLWAGTAATKMSMGCCLISTATCTAATTHTFASPAATKFSSTQGTGLLSTGMTVAPTTGSAAIIGFDHTFTSTGTFNVTGFIANNASGYKGDVAYVECCFASVIAMAATDTLTIDGQVTVATTS